jgi:hypothetical protein
MAYTMSATGNKADVIGQLRQQAASQSAALTSQAERDQLTDSVNDVEKYVNENASDNDSIGVTINGHISQTESSSLAMSRSVGVSISRGAAAPAPAAAAPAAGTPTPATPAPGAPSAPAATPRI